MNPGSSDSSDTPRRPCPGGTGKKRPCWARAPSSWCSNHDPALADRRRLNGAKGLKPKRHLPSEERPWAPSKAMRDAEREEHAAEAIARRVEELLAGPLPSPAHRRETTLRVLLAVLEEPRLSSSARVGAAKLLLEDAARELGTKPGGNPDATNSAAPPRPWMRTATDPPQ